jgi:hypothetical protein
MGDTFIIYKTDATWMMQLVGGQFVFRTSKVLRQHGMLAQGCCVEVKRKHMLLTRGDVIVHDGHSVDSIINRKNRRELFSVLDGDFTYKAKALLNYRLSEVWFCVPTGGSNGRLTTAFIFNWEENTWTRRDLPSIAGGASGLVQVTGNFTFDGDTPGSFDAAEGPFGLTGSYRASERLLLAKPDATAAIFLADDTNQFNSVNFQAAVRRESLPLVAQDREGNPIVDPDTVKFVRAVHPRMAGGATVSFYVGYQMTLDESITWTGPYSFVIGTDTKIDLSISGRYLSYRIEDTVNQHWHFHGLDIEMEVIGRF